MSTYLADTLSKLKSSGSVSPDPLAEIRRHSTLFYLADALEAIEDDHSIELAELAASVALVSYQEGVEIGWDAHKKTVREMDGGL